MPEHYLRGYAVNSEIGDFRIGSGCVDLIVQRLSFTHLAELLALEDPIKRAF